MKVRLSSLSIEWSGSEYTPGQGLSPDHFIRGTTFKNPQIILSATATSHVAYV